MFFLIKRQGAVLFKMKYLKSETETEKKSLTRFCLRPMFSKLQ